MEFHYPNSAWVSLRRDVYDRLCAFRRQAGLASWEEAIERLLPKMEIEEVKA
jgi:predicted CopG family antitoxin